MNPALYKAHLEFKKTLYKMRPASEKFSSVILAKDTIRWGELKVNEKLYQTAYFSS